jgi:uncharacterized protein with HEPN domain
MSYEEFSQDPKTIDSIITPLTQLGETAAQMLKYYPKDTTIPYQEMITMRNFLVHAYHKIDIKTVYKTATINVPQLYKQLENL